MNKPIYQCNNCGKRHYSLESLSSCGCKFKGKGRIKWNTPGSRMKEKGVRLLNWSIWRK